MNPKPASRLFLYSSLPSVTVLPAHHESLPTFEVNPPFAVDPMVSHSYIMVGGGTHASVVADAILSLGHTIVAVFDQKPVSPLPGLTSIGDYRPDAFPGAIAVLAIGDNRIRLRLSTGISEPFGSVISKTAILSDHLTIGEGAMILQGAVIQARSVIGRHVIINTRASVDHDARIADFVHIGPGSVLCGNVTVGEGALVGAGSTILPGITIGPWAVVGAGSVVIRDVPAGAVVAGNPARKLKENIQLP